MGGAGISAITTVVAARIPNLSAERLRRRARERGERVSPYVARLIQQDLDGRVESRPDEEREIEVKA
jgi:hypothetical protein